MPTIEFTATPKLPADYAHLGYVKGMRITDRKGWCDKWVRRGCAVYVGGEISAEIPPGPEVIVNASPTVEQTADEAPRRRRGRPPRK